MVIIGIFMYVLDKYLPFGEFDFFGREMLTYLLLALGFLIMAAALFAFGQAKTTTDPVHPKKATSLVTKGISITQEIQCIWLCFFS